MKEFKSLVASRRSHRKFTTERISEEDLYLILRAALMSPTSKNQRSWQFVVVTEAAVLKEMSMAKDAGSAFLADAPMAIVVTGDVEQNSCWVEDGAIAAISMQYQAEELGLGSCWIQIRGRYKKDGTSATSVIQKLLCLDEKQEVLCVLAIGHWVDERKSQDEEKLKWEQVHYIK